MRGGWQATCIISLSFSLARSLALSLSRSLAFALALSSSSIPPPPPFPRSPPFCLPLSLYLSLYHSFSHPRDLCVQLRTGEPKLFAAACQATKSTLSTTADYNRIPGAEQLIWVLVGIALPLGFKLAGRLRVLVAGLAVRLARDGANKYKQNDAYCAHGGVSAA